MNQDHNHNRHANVQNADFIAEELELKNELNNGHCSDQIDHKQVSCSVCKDRGHEWLLPVVQCKECAMYTHLCCDPNVKFTVKDDVFDEVKFEPSQIQNYHHRCIESAQRDFVCSLCVHRKQTWIRLKEPYVHLDGCLVNEYRIEVLPAQERIVVHERAHSSADAVIRSYPIRDKDDPVLIDKLLIANGAQRFMNVQKMQESVAAFKELCGEKYALESEYPIPQYYGYAFVNSGNPTGVITADATLTMRELQYLQQNKMECFWKRSNDPTRPEWLRNAGESADYGCKEEGRLKVYMGYRYEYGSNRKQCALRKAELPCNLLDFLPFLELRFKGVWKDMITPNMAQINRYDASTGIGHHADEIAWFRKPVYSLRLHGWINLHFGMHGQTNVHPKCKRLAIHLGPRSMMKMGGLFQLMYKHGIRKYKGDHCGKSITLLLREANELAVGAPMKML